MNVRDTKNILGSLSAFQTILERYPVLLADDYYGGRDCSLTSISFMLDILKLFGVDTQTLYDWLTRLLLDYEDKGGSKVADGILTTIEQGVKGIILTYLTKLYTCPIDPVLPAYFSTNGAGIDISLSRVDAFGLLQNCPTSKNGSIFYFDNNFSPSSVWKSTDLNAYLWYVINKGGNVSNNNLWDNRVLYRGIFNGEDGDTKRNDFLSAPSPGSSVFLVPGVGVKKNIFYTTFKENSGKMDGEALNVHAVASRYFNGKTKTIRQFNTDYVMSLKLFDSKTLMAQILNSMMGISEMIPSMSLDLSIMLKKVEKVVEKVMLEEKDDATEDEVDGYFTFSDEDYNDIEKDATLQYNQKYESGNEEGDLSELDIQGITTFIEEIGAAKTDEDKANAIHNALANISKSMSISPEINFSDSFSFERNFIFDFIKNVAVQIAMQTLSPKVMLLFAINAKFLGDESVSETIYWEGFFKDFWNLLRSCIRKITEIILQELLEFVLSFIKPVLVLVAKMLLLEKIQFYKNLLEQLLRCMQMRLLGAAGFENMLINDVNYADIIPKQIIPGDNQNKKGG